jgi:hypothetical protein
MVQNESSNPRRWWKVHPLFDKLYLTRDQDEEREEAQAKTRRGNRPVKRVIRRRPDGMTG